jgi:hypothetical protein
MPRPLLGNAKRIGVKRHVPQDRTGAMIAIRPDVPDLFLQGAPAPCRPYEAADRAALSFRPHANSHTADIDKVFLVTSKRIPKTSWESELLYPKRPAKGPYLIDARSGR